MANKKYDYSNELSQSENYNEIAEELRKIQPEITDAHKKLNRIIERVDSCDESIRGLRTLLKLPVSIKFSEAERRILINEIHAVADSTVSHIRKECDNVTKDIHRNDKRIMLTAITFWCMIALLLIFATFFAIIVFANITDLHNKILSNIIWIFLSTLSVAITVIIIGFKYFKTVNK